MTVPHSGVTCHAPVKGRPGAMWLSVTSVPDQIHPRKETP